MLFRSIFVLILLFMLALCAVLVHFLRSCLFLYLYFFLCLRSVLCLRSICARAYFCTYTSFYACAILNARALFTLVISIHCALSYVCAQFMLVFRLAPVLMFVLLLSVVLARFKDLPDSKQDISPNDIRARFKVVPSPRN